MDVCLSMTKQYLRGWNANKVMNAKKAKSDILKRLAEMDEMAEFQHVGEGFWSKRYQLEAQLEKIYHGEELY
jgi:hypothetical protein